MTDSLTLIKDVQICGNEVLSSLKHLRQFSHNLKIIVYGKSVVCYLSPREDDLAMISLKIFLPLLTGVLLGATLSAIILYPNKIATILKPTAKVIKLPLKDNLNGNLYNSSIADELNKNIRVLCWILTTPENHKTKAIHVQKTWGKKCNKLLFMSTQYDRNIEGLVALPVKEGRGTLWDKTRSALQYIYNHHFNEADWFIKADDDS